MAGPDEAGFWLLHLAGVDSGEWTVASTSKRRSPAVLSADSFRVAKHRGVVERRAGLLASLTSTSQAHSAPARCLGHLCASVVTDASSTSRRFRAMWRFSKSQRTA